ncbi:thioredoxin family protein [Pontimicrobium aquaticum]|uniref:Thioredoxin family protein n=1 Tax=Pontimicrobium aquaticum TaxID=2565367 RepID=A0A4U0F159_9FLAO|nr:thioredoxin family protein [Pontimicrobium aquaticum]TJY37990.1 thioredoxin family protein [Pontimicrobium aquaticum]
MQQIIKQGLENSINYSDFKRLMKRLALDKFTTGDVISEAYINYTMLNEKRMSRWDKKIEIPKDIEAKIKAYNTKVIWLVITESWCGDAAHVLPVVNKVAELSDTIELRIALRDDNEDLMNLFLTNGNKSIPKLIMIDANTMEVVSTYGPRPKKATKLVNDYKEQHGKLTPEFKQDLQVWYNKDKGQSTLEDLTEMLCEFQPSFCL